ncbi:GNAT family N-acetyltransferase [Actinomadura rubrisoli]|uniref:GNAT family N-acetyltransferase n=1 Tax=Actinomadura rubrisoli TaxID=2530368 RepID=UPI001404383A|nr:GNAT family N-acetyltransferase [Actinomadura rubrisoli]
MKVEVFERIDQVGRKRWDDLVVTSGAPVFYRSEFLAAFEKVPLHGSQRRAYVTGSDRAGALRFALPVHVMRGVDPMRVLADHFPARADETVLLSHVWHCYDTWLPSDGLDAEVVDAAVGALRDVAAEAGASAFGFVNVEADGALARALDEAGVPGADIDRRFNADVSSFGDLDDYLATLDGKQRRNLRRYLRRAEDAGVTTTMIDPAEGDLDGFVELAREGAAKYGNADYYRPGVFQEFVRSLGPAARLLEIRVGGCLAGASIALLDSRRVHWWACGSDYEAIPMVSPFYLAFLNMLREAIARGRPVLEVGRRNEAFKLKHGLRARTVRAYLADVEEGTA